MMKCVKKGPRRIPDTPHFLHPRWTAMKKKTQLQLLLSHTSYTEIKHATHTDKHCVCAIITRTAVWRFEWHTHTHTLLPARGWNMRWRSFRRTARANSILQHPVLGSVQRISGISSSHRTNSLFLSVLSACFDGFTGLMLYLFRRQLKKSCLPACVHRSGLTLWPLTCKVNNTDYLFILAPVSEWDTLGNKRTFCPQTWRVRSRKNGQKAGKMGSAGPIHTGLTKQLTGLKGSVANIWVPDTTAHLVLHIPCLRKPKAPWEIKRQVLFFPSRGQ